MSSSIAPDLEEENLLLLLMGSSERTKKGIHSIFESMEHGALPIIRKEIGRRN